jgi:hypothetical protein
MTSYTQGRCIIAFHDETGFFSASLPTVYYRLAVDYASLVVASLWKNFMS